MTENAGEPTKTPKDIDELLSMPGGVEILEELEANAEDSFDVLLEEELGGCVGAQGKAAAALRILKFISENPDALARELMVQKLSKATGLGIHKLRRSLVEAGKGGGDETETRGARSGNADDWLSLEVANAYKDSLGGHIAFHRDGFARFDGKAYVAVADGEMSARVGQYIQLNEHGKPTTSFVNNTLGNLRSMAVEPYELDAPFWRGSHHPAPRVMCLANGILDLDAWLSDSGDALREHTPDLYTLNYLPYDYAPDDECPGWDEFLDTILPDKEAQDILMEWFGYCLIPTQSMQAILVMVGDGANGKSVVCDVLAELVGRNNCSSQPLENIHEGFNLMPLMNKLVNFSSELSRLSPGAEGIVKAISGGDRPTVNRKNKDQLNNVPIMARLTVTTNAMPHVTDRTDALWRRLLFMPFEVKIPEEKRVAKEKLVKELCKELPGILNRALAGLARLLERGRFLDTETGKMVKEDQKRRSNTALAFVEECIVPEANTMYWHPKVEVYERYCDWCREQGIKHPQSGIEFGRTLVDYLKRNLPEFEAKDFTGKNRHKGKLCNTYRHLKFRDEGDGYEVG